MRHSFGLIAASLLVSSCGISPPVRTMACDTAVAPRVLTADGQRSIELKVLTFNIEGLGFPARTGRAPQLRRIGEHLAAMRAAGTGPDVVLFQEMFSDAAKKAVAASGYPAITSGPQRTTRASQQSEAKLPGKAKLKRGEIGLHFAGSGLAIASRYPIVATDRLAYGSSACAGLDCLSNKGIVLARIAIPDVPTPIDIYDTHMNSRGASKAPAARNLAAHDRQALQASRFIDQTHDDAFPIVFGGDFNMRRSNERWDNFTRYQQMSLVHRTCADPASGCEVKLSWDGDAPWMDTQDLQFYWSGSPVAILPIRVEALFDGSPGSPQLSDHDGFMVTYRLSWQAQIAASPRLC